MHTELIITLQYRLTDIDRCREGSWSYDDELDDVSSIIMDVCEALSECPGVKFVVTGFSEGAWPVDVSTDLPIVLEQVSSALQNLRNAVAFSIGFYEQGIEHVMNFQPNGEVWTVECVDMNSMARPGAGLQPVEESKRVPGWAPRPVLLEVTRDRMETMLRTLVVDFLTLTARRCPELLDHPWLQDWKRKILGG